MELPMVGDMLIAAGTVQMANRRKERVCRFLAGFQVQDSFASLSVIHYTYTRTSRNGSVGQDDGTGLIHEKLLCTFPNPHTSMNTFDRMKRLVGLHGSSSEQQQSISAVMESSSEDSGHAVKMTNRIWNGANTSEQRQFVDKPPLALDLALTTLDSNNSNQSQYCEQSDLFFDLLVNEVDLAPPDQSLSDSLHATGHGANPPSFSNLCAAIIEGAESSSSSKAPYTRGHRRRSTHVTRRDLEKFQKEVLGVDTRPPWYVEENGSSQPISPNDPQLEELNRAFALADMSMNSSAGGMAAGNNPGPGMFANYTETSPTPNMSSIPRQSPSPAYPHPAPQVNGGGPPTAGMGAAMNASMSMNAGHQMDLHHLYEMVLELSEVLKNNREVTKSIVSSAEDIMVCFHPCNHVILQLS